MLLKRAMLVMCPSHTNFGTACSLLVDFLVGGSTHARLTAWILRSLASSESFAKAHDALTNLFLCFLVKLSSVPVKAEILANETLMSSSIQSSYEVCMNHLRVSIKEKGSCACLIAPFLSLIETRLEMDTSSNTLFGEIIVQCTTCAPSSSI